MNMEDLKFLREMVVKSETEDFSDEQLQRIGNALRTNVNADDTTEALDLTAQIIENQDMRADRDKLQKDAAKEIMKQHRENADR